VIESYYRNYHPFETLRSQLRNIYAELSELEMLSDINRRILEWLFSLLQISSQISVSVSSESTLKKSQRLLQICSDLNATEYVTGPSAREYLQEPVFHEAGIRVRWIDYRLLPKPHSVDRHGVELSILHTLLSLGVEETIRLSTFTTDTPL